MLNGNERTYARGSDSVKTPGGHVDGSRNYENNEAVVIQTNEPGVQRVYGSRERLIDGFPNMRNEEGFDNMQTPVKSLAGGVRATPRDSRVMPPLPVLRSNHHPNFSGLSEVISPIMPSSPISPQQQQRRLANAQQQEVRGNYEHENPYQRSEILSHQQMQRKIQSHPPPPTTPDAHGNYSTARAHLVQTIEGSPQRPGIYERHYPASQEPTYTTGSYLPPHQRRPPPNPGMKPVYRDLRAHPISDLSQSSPNLTEGQDGNLTANLESNGVYISKTPNPKFSHSETYAYSQNPIYGSRPLLPPPANPEGSSAHTPTKTDKKMESETDDDGGFKKPSGAIRKEYQGSSRSLSGEGKSEEKNFEKESQETMEKENEKKEGENNEEGKNERNDAPAMKCESFSPRNDLRSQDNKVSSATSSDYEKATRRSLGQGSSLGDSGRGSAAYSSGRQESGRGSAEYSSGREKPTCKERVDTSTESSDGIKRDSIHSGYASQKALPRGEWV